VFPRSVAKTEDNKFTIHHSPFTIYHSPFTIYHSPFIIHHLSFTIYHSSFKQEIFYEKLKSIIHYMSCSFFLFYGISARTGREGNSATGDTGLQLNQHGKGDKFYPPGNRRGKNSHYK